MLGVVELVELAFRGVQARVPRAAGRGAQFVVRLALGPDAALVDEDALAGALRGRLKVDGPRVRYSIRIERCPDRLTHVEVTERTGGLALT